MATYPILPEPLPLALPDGWTVPASFAPAADLAWRTAEAKVRALVERHPDRFPLYTQGGAWAVDAEAWTNWCEGFLGGQLWMLADHTGEAWFRNGPSTTATSSNTARTTAPYTTWASCSGPRGAAGTRPPATPPATTSSCTPGAPPLPASSSGAATCQASSPPTASSSTS